MVVLVQLEASGRLEQNSVLSKIFHSFGWGAYTKYFRTEQLRDSSYALHRLVAPCTVGKMNRRRLVSREVGLLAGHAGIVHTAQP